MFIATLFTIARTCPRCLSTDEWIKKWWCIHHTHTHTRIYLSQKKEPIWISCSEVDEPRACYTQWSKSEKDLISYISEYIWNLEEWYWWTYLQGRNRDADVENRLVDTTGGEGGNNWESIMETYISPCVKTVGRKPLYNIGSSIPGSVTT